MKILNREYIRQYERNRRVILKSYKDAVRILGNKDKVKLGNNTELHLMSGAIVVRHFHTSVVTYRPDGSIQLDNGGFLSATTKKRLNLYSPFIVEQQKGQWYCHTAAGVFRFDRGMTILSNGEAMNPNLKVLGISLVQSTEAEEMTDSERYQPEPDYRHDAKRNGDLDPNL